MLTKNSSDLLSLLRVVSGTQDGKRLPVAANSHVASDVELLQRWVDREANIGEEFRVYMHLVFCVNCLKQVMAMIEDEKLVARDSVVA